MNKKILYKLLLIFVLLAVTLFINTISSYAFTGTNCNGDTIEIPDYSSVVEEYKYHIVYKGVSTGKFFLVLCNSEPFLSDTSIQCDYPARYIYNNDWVLDEKYDYKNFTFPSASTSDFSAIYYSNFDVKDESGNVLFQQPPLEEETPVEEKQETTLAPIVEELETEKTLQEVVGILPLIIVVVVSLVGLRKALKMLLTVLNRA